MFLLDRAFTVTEAGRPLRGQVLASGRVLVVDGPHRGPSPRTLLLRTRWDGLQLQWLGLQLAWAFGELTGTGSLVFSLAAAVPAVAAWVVTRRLGAAGAVTLLVLLSPMSALLS